MEVMGFEPMAPALQEQCSTTELNPHEFKLEYIYCCNPKVPVELMSYSSNHKLVLALIKAANVLVVIKL